MFCGASVLGVNFWQARLISQGDSQGYARAMKQVADKTAEAKARAEKQTADLQAKADKQRKETSDAIRRLTADRDAAIERLRDRPERPSSSDLPAIAGNELGCTGASLFRSDSQFLVREAARADGLRIELARCEAAYDQARQSLDAN